MREPELLALLKKIRYDLTGLQGKVSEALRQAAALELVVETDPVPRCRGWILGSGWDETFDSEQVRDELETICRRGRVSLSKDALAGLVEEWTVVKGERYGKAA